VLPRGPVERMQPSSARRSIGISALRAPKDRCKRTRSGDSSVSVRARLATCRSEWTSISTAAVDDPLFVGTSAFAALTDRRDRNHSSAKRILKTAARHRRPLLTSTYVLDEAITLLRFKLGHDAATQFGERLAATSWCRVLEVDPDVRAMAWQIFVRYRDQTFSFTDCTSFALMRAMGLTEAFTFDRNDFQAAGFVPLS
jgi:uncharacterized protein